MSAPQPVKGLLDAIDKTKIEQDPQFDSKELQYFTQTVDRFHPDVATSRKMLVHSLSSQMKRQNLYEKMTQILQNPILQAAAQEDYLKFSRELMR